MVLILVIALCAISFLAGLLAYGTLRHISSRQRLRSVMVLLKAHSASAHAFVMAEGWFVGSIVLTIGLAIGLLCLLQPAPVHIFGGSGAVLLVILGIRLWEVRRSRSSAYKLLSMYAVLAVMLLLTVIELQVLAIQQADASRSFATSWVAVSFVLASLGAGLIVWKLHKWRGFALAIARIALITVPAIYGFALLSTVSSITSQPPPPDARAHDADIDLFISSDKAMPASVGLIAGYRFDTSETPPSGEVIYLIRVPADSPPFDWVLSLTGPAVLLGDSRIPAGAVLEYDGTVAADGTARPSVPVRHLREQLYSGHYDPKVSGGIGYYGDPDSCARLATSSIKSNELGSSVPDVLLSGGFELSGLVDFSAFPDRSDWWLNGAFPSVGLPSKTNIVQFGDELAKAWKFPKFVSPAGGYACTQISIDNAYQYVSSFPLAVVGDSGSPSFASTDPGLVTFVAPLYVTRPHVLYRKSGWQNAANNASFVAGGLLALSGAALLTQLDRIVERARRKRGSQE